MADLIKKIKIKKQDGTFTDYIPIGAEAENINVDGESVEYKLNKKPYYYNSIADMKADTKLKVGDMAVTLGYYEPNDGGGAEYKIVKTSDNYIEELENNLKAELISNKNNVLSYGVETTDKNNNNHIIIKSVIDNEKYAFCDKNIVLKNSLVLDSVDTKFVFNKITYTGTSYGILLNNCNIVLEGQYLLSNGDGLRLGQTNLVLFCNIKMNGIKAEKNAIILGGTKGVYYNTLDIIRINYKQHGILTLLDDFYVGENSFYNCAFTDDSDSSITEQYAVMCNATNYRATGFKFYNISFEGTKGGFYFEGNNKLCEHLYVYGLRAAEASFKNYKILKIKCNQTTIPLYGDIFFDDAKPSSFDFSEYTVSENNALVLHGAFRTAFNNSNDLLGYEGHPCYTKLIISKLPRERDVIRTSNEPVLIQATSLVGLPPSGQTTPNTLKIKIGDNSYSYNGPIKLYIDNININSVDIYANDGDTLVKSIIVNNRPCIIDAQFRNLATNGQTDMIYSISNIGAISQFNN